MADEQFAHHADCDGESFEVMCLGCEHARQMELMNEIEQLREALRGLLFCPGILRAHDHRDCEKTLIAQRKAVSVLERKE